MKRCSQNTLRVEKCNPSKNGQTFCKNIAWEISPSYEKRTNNITKKALLRFRLINICLQMFRNSSCHKYGP